MTESNIYLKGTTIGTIANVDVYYHLPLVKPGKYTLVVSCIGYTDMQNEIEVAGDEELEQNFEYTFNTGGIAEVVNTMQAEGKIKAINQQINANAILDVVAVERIPAIPDANVTESLGRLSGISLVRNNGEGYKIVIQDPEPKPYYNQRNENPILQQ